MSDCTYCCDSKDCAHCPHLSPPGCEYCYGSGICQACKPGKARPVRGSDVTIECASQDGMAMAIDWFAEIEDREAQRRMR